MYCLGVVANYVTSLIFLVFFLSLLVWYNSAKEKSSRGAEGNYCFLNCGVSKITYFTLNERYYLRNRKCPGICILKMNFYSFLQKVSPGTCSISVWLYWGYMQILHPKEERELWVFLAHFPWSSLLCPSTFMFSHLCCAGDTALITHSLHCYGSTLLMSVNRHCFFLTPTVTLPGVAVKCRADCAWEEHPGQGPLL